MHRRPRCAPLLHLLDEGAHLSAPHVLVVLKADRLIVRVGLVDGLEHLGAAGEQREGSGGEYISGEQVDHRLLRWHAKRDWIHTPKHHIDGAVALEDKHVDANIEQVLAHPADIGDEPVGNAMHGLVLDRVRLLDPMDNLTTRTAPLVRQVHAIDRHGARVAALAHAGEHALHLLNRADHLAMLLPDDGRVALHLAIVLPARDARLPDRHQLVGLRAK
mmetsp:Transcript_48587/g.96890  ORF Transcript_48587/g.96890 Transcript_48587/m.96890 type:complete len:218 (-) Transcript_48587:2546-3199(-)